MELTVTRLLRSCSLHGGFTGGTNNVAVIASGANYPDALSANYLAAGLNGGAGTRVLLTDPNVLPQPTSQALITGGIKTVYIVGGTAAVSANVSNAIAAMHVGNNNANAFINVIRVAGADRYATNNQVDLFNGAAVGVNTAIVAVGSNFADALSVAPVSRYQEVPAGAHERSVAFRGGPVDAGEPRHQERDHRGWHVGSFRSDRSVDQGPRHHDRLPDCGC